MICDCRRLSSSDKVKDLILSLFFCLLSVKINVKKVLTVFFCMLICHVSKAICRLWDVSANVARLSTKKLNTYSLL